MGDEMLDNLSKYVYEVYRSKSVSDAAKKLFISQPALSASIKKAETELGAAIFNRKTIPFTLTAEGKIYIESIEKVMKLETETLEKIHDVSEIKGGVLNISTSSYLAYFVIPKVCEIFAKKYPNVNINISTASTEALAGHLANDTADIVFMPTESDAQGFFTVPLLEENIIVALRKDFKDAQSLYPYALSYDDVVNRNYPIEKKIEDMSIFHGIEFIYSPPKSRVFKKKKILFGDTYSSHFVGVSSPNQRLNYNLMLSGFGAFLTTDSAVATMPDNDECMYFVLENPDAKQHFSLAYSATEDSSSHKLICEFVNTAKEFFDCENPLLKLK